MIALGVLVLSVFFGPAVLGGPAFADADCCASCHSDEPGSQTANYAKNVHAEPDDCCPSATTKHTANASASSHGHSHASDHSDHSDDTAPDHDCPDDCPGCDLGLSFAVTMNSSLRVNFVPLMSDTCALASHETPATGTCAGIYRPPRSLS
ncbi:MAG: hypothetical protein AB8H86_19960 [Polyangiales bacterium]